MSCEGFEHGDTVVLREPLRDFPLGMTAVIRAKNEKSHTIDVYVEGVGVLKGLNAHSFVRKSEFGIPDEMGHGYATDEA